MKAQQCVKLTSTNRPFGLTIKFTRRIAITPRRNRHGETSPANLPAAPFGLQKNVVCRMTSSEGPVAYISFIPMLFSCERSGRAALQRRVCQPFRIVIPRRALARRGTCSWPRLIAKSSFDIDVPGSACNPRLEPSGRKAHVNEAGDFTAGEIPVPIPNTEVKPRRADCTARESVWESRSSPT